ncbi:MAG: hypothetical protein M3145_00265, partial [Pseudomonadota bacterium]|nr:hypothetical protein [Pseudomonadota bacterium]
EQAGSEACKIPQEGDIGPSIWGMSDQMCRQVGLNTFMFDARVQANEFDWFLGFSALRVPGRHPFFCARR